MIFLENLVYIFAVSKCDHSDGICVFKSRGIMLLLENLFFHHVHLSDAF